MPFTFLSNLHTLIPRSESNSKPKILHALTDTDIESLVPVLSKYPALSSNLLEITDYLSSKKTEIHDLPSHLRASFLTSLFTHVPRLRNRRGRRKWKLCVHHAGLNASLITSTFETLRREICCKAIPWIHPVLTCPEAVPTVLHDIVLLIRTLEPVSRMWDPSFDIDDCTPEGYTPLINEYHKWYFQENRCPGCMLARLGSHRKVLAALLAVMVARYTPESVGGRGRGRSRRVKWVECSLGGFPAGEGWVSDAWGVGDQLKIAKMRMIEGDRKGWRR